MNDPSRPSYVSGGEYAQALLDYGQILAPMPPVRRLQEVADLGVRLDEDSTK